MICLNALILNRGRCTSLEVHRFLFLWSVFPRTGFLLGFYLLVAIFDTEKNCCCAGSMAYEDMLLVASLEVGCCRALLGGRCRGLLTSTRLCFRDWALRNRGVLALRWGCGCGGRQCSVHGCCCLCARAWAGAAHYIPCCVAACCVCGGVLRLD